MCFPRHYIMSGDFPVLFLNSIFVSHQGLQKLEYVACFNQDFKWQRSKSNLLFPSSFWSWTSSLAQADLNLLPWHPECSWGSNLLKDKNDHSSYWLMLTFSSSWKCCLSHCVCELTRFWSDVPLKASYLLADLTWYKDSVQCLIQGWRVSLHPPL